MQHYYYEIIQNFFVLNLSHLPSNFVHCITLFMSKYLLIIVHSKVSKWLGKLKEKNILLDFPEFVSQYTVSTEITYTVWCGGHLFWIFTVSFSIYLLTTFSVFLCDFFIEYFCICRVWFAVSSVHSWSVIYLINHSLESPIYLLSETSYFICNYYYVQAFFAGLDPG